MKTTYADYVINVGNTWDDLEPVDSAYSIEEGIEKAKATKKKCKEVVYSPCENEDIDGIVWRNQRGWKRTFYKYKIRCYNIKWETDDNDKLLEEQLPKELVFDDYVDEEDIEDTLIDWLSDQTGFLHCGFEYEIIDKQ